MCNSRLRLIAREDEVVPPNRNLSVDTPYRPGFVDEKDLETIKMAVDKELAEISNAFYKTTERAIDTTNSIDSILVRLTSIEDRLTALEAKVP